MKHADADTYPDAGNTYRFQTFGLFHVAPAQDSFDPSKMPGQAMA